MNMLESLVLVVHVLIALGICGLVLLQHGKGADMGAAFGSGSSGSLFGASGSANFLSRSTAVLVALFFATSLGLTWFATTHGPVKSLMQQGIEEKGASKSSEVPTSPGALPAAPAPDEPGKAAPAAAPAGSKAGEVPK
jgi:preprotein translocase subunit SecG